MTVAFPTFPAGHVITADEAQVLLPKFAILAADQNSLSDAGTITLVPIAGLAFAVEANASYECDVLLLHAATDATTDVMINYTAPAGLTAYSTAYGKATGGTTGFNALYDGGQFAFGGSGGGVSFGTDGNTATAYFAGVIVCGGTAGTFQMQFARATAGLGKVTTIKTGSYIKARRIA
jgi:hypothetical protein